MARQKKQPGQVRDAIVRALAARPKGASISEIQQGVTTALGPTPASSVRSYLRLNTPKIFVRSERGTYSLRADLFDAASLDVFATPVVAAKPSIQVGLASLVHADCLEWLRQQPPNSVHAVVTDPPYGLIEYSPEEQAKLKARKGGVWRIPPSFDGAKRSPLPRFTVLNKRDLVALDEFFYCWGKLVLSVLTPGANVVVASNPLLSYVVSGALARAGLERRGEIVRLVMTMRGGDRPKAAHEEFAGVSVMPRAMWEPWLLFRKPLDGRVQDTLRRWGTGGFKRPTDERPFGDVIASSPTRQSERAIAPHPSLKPQAFLRNVVRAVLPLGKGTVLDPFAGSGSTLAAANAVGYKSIGVEKDSDYFAVAKRSIAGLSALPV